MKNNKKKKWLATAAALAAVAAMVGTFAWFTSKDSAKNSFEGSIAGNDIEIVEEFTPPTDWTPGTKVNKDVAVKNSGKYDSLIRVSLKETIKKLASADPKYGDSETNLNEDAFLFALTKKDFTGYTASKVSNPDKMTIANNTQEKGIYNGAYTLKAMEKSTDTADGGKKYEYIAFWEKDSDANVKLYAKTGGFKRAADNSITPNNKAKYQYVNLAYGSGKVVNWTGEGNIAPISTTPHVPTPAITDGAASITLEGAADNLILIEFINLEKTPKAGKWSYNEQDGNFYYISVVKPEVQTAQLIDSVTLSNKANNSYSKVKYDLDVSATGIQAFKEAVDSADWLNGTSTNSISPALKALPGMKDGNGKVNP